jgi:hypothetical protein
MTTIYWTSLEDEWIRAEDPVSISSKYFPDNTNLLDGVSGVSSCPAVKDYMKGLFGLRSMYDYSFEIREDGMLYSEVYDQNFFNKHVLVRDQDKRFFSFQQEFIFFSDTPGTKMVGLLPPFLEDNYTSKFCSPIVGEFDIGTWFRPLDFAFYLRSDVNQFRIDHGEIYSYLHFDSGERLNFKKFYPSDTIRELATAHAAANKNKTTPFSMEKYYDVAIDPEVILREIRRALV